MDNLQPKKEQRKEQRKEEKNLENPQRKILTWADVYV